MQSSEYPSIDYLGREEEAGSADSLLKHYIGAYDPATGKLQIMEARRMVIRGTVRSQNAAPEAFAERDTLTVRYPSDVLELWLTQFIECTTSK